MSNINRGRYTWDETQTVLGSTILIRLSKDSDEEVDTYDTINSIKQHLINEGWYIGDIFVSLECLLTA